MIRPFHVAALLMAHAVPTLAESDVQQWLTVSAKTEVGKSVAVHGESIARFGHDSGGLYEIENVLLFGYKLTDQVIAWAGYVHNPTYADREFTVTEHRAREQITVDNFAQLGPASLSARLRLEQRWRDGVDGTGWRVRPYLKAAIPLGDPNSPMLSFTAEPFFNLNTTTFQTAGIDRLRSAVSLSIPVGDAARLEAGYLNQHRFIRGSEDSGDHALTIALALTL